MSSGKSLPAVKVEGIDPVLPTVHARIGVGMQMRLDQANLSVILPPKRVYGETVRQACGWTRI